MGDTEQKLKQSQVAEPAEQVDDKGLESFLPDINLESMNYEEGAKARSPISEQNSDPSQSSTDNRPRHTFRIPKALAHLFDHEEYLAIEGSCEGSDYGIENLVDLQTLYTIEEISLILQAVPEDDLKFFILSQKEPIEPTPGSLQELNKNLEEYRYYLRLSHKEIVTHREAHRYIALKAMYLQNFLDAHGDILNKETRSKLEAQIADTEAKHQELPWDIDIAKMPQSQLEPVSMGIAIPNPVLAATAMLVSMGIIVIASPKEPIELIPEIELPLPSLGPSLIALTQLTANNLAVETLLMESFISTGNLLEALAFQGKSTGILAGAAGATAISNMVKNSSPDGPPPDPSLWKKIGAIIGLTGIAAPTIDLIANALRSAPMSKRANPGEQNVNQEPQIVASADPDYDEDALWGDYDRMTSTQEETDTERLSRNPRWNKEVELVVRVWS